MATGTRPATPDKQVAKGVSLVIFGGILNVMSGLVALVGSGSLTRGLYPWVSVATGALLVLCARGLRRSWVALLYVTGLVLVVSSAWFCYALSQALFPGVLIQVPVGLWLVWVVHRLAGPMKQLRATGARPDRANPYHEVFLRRFSG